jgi:hypothetical protein
MKLDLVKNVKKFDLVIIKTFDYSFDLVKFDLSTPTQKFDVNCSHVSEKIHVSKILK